MSLGTADRTLYGARHFIDPSHTFYIGFENSPEFYFRVRPLLALIERISCDVQYDRITTMSSRYVPTPNPVTPNPETEPE